MVTTLIGNNIVTVIKRGLFLQHCNNNKDREYC